MMTPDQQRRMGEAMADVAAALYDIAAALPGAARILHDLSIDLRVDADERDGDGADDDTIGDALPGHHAYRGPDA